MNSIRKYINLLENNDLTVSKSQEVSTVNSTDYTDYVLDPKQELAMIDLNNVIFVGCDSESANTLYYDMNEAFRSDNDYLAIFSKSGGDKVSEVKRMDTYTDYGENFVLPVGDVEVKPTQRWCTYF